MGVSQFSLPGAAPHSHGKGSTGFLSGRTGGLCLTLMRIPWSPGSLTSLIPAQFREGNGNAACYPCPGKTLEYIDGLTTYLVLIPQSPILLQVKSCLNSAATWISFSLFPVLIPRFPQASGKNLNLNDESQHGLLMQLLKLTHNCLNFDFIGTSTDESSDDLCTVQIPTSWRSGSSCRNPQHPTWKMLKPSDLS